MGDIVAVHPESFIDEAQKIFWEFERYIINEVATDEELKKFND